MNILTFNRVHRTGRPLPRLADIVARIDREWRIARDIGRLEEMSDDELRDIGLTRGDIAHAVRHGRGGDCSAP